MHGGFDGLANTVLARIKQEFQVMTVGADLRQARERAGLSAEEISHRTKINLHRIEALEQGDFENLPSGFYLKALIRAYAHEVAIDPEPLIRYVCPDQPEFVEGTSAVSDAVSVVHQPVFTVPTARTPTSSSGAIALVAALAVFGGGAYLFEAAYDAFRSATSGITFGEPVPVISTEVKIADPAVTVPVAIPVPATFTVAVNMPGDITRVSAPIDLPRVPAAEPAPALPDTVGAIGAVPALPPEAGDMAPEEQATPSVP